MCVCVCVAGCPSHCKGTCSEGRVDRHRRAWVQVGGETARHLTTQKEPKDEGIVIIEREYSKDSILLAELLGSIVLARCVKGEIVKGGNALYLHVCLAYGLEGFQSTEVDIISVICLTGPGVE